MARKKQLERLAAVQPPPAKTLTRSQRATIANATGKLRPQCVAGCQGKLSHSIAEPNAELRVHTITCNTCAAAISWDEEIAPAQPPQPEARPAAGGDAAAG